MLDLSQWGIHIPFVFAIIFIIQTIKYFMEKYLDKVLDGDVWKVVVLAMGVPMAIIMQGVEGFGKFNIFLFLLTCFLYSAASGMIYQTYKLGKKRVKDLLEKVNGN